MKKSQLALANMIRIAKAYGNTHTVEMEQAGKALADLVAGEGHSVSDWKCVQCDQDQWGKDVTLSGIAESGTPVCPYCDNDMILVEERWVEDPS